MLPLYDAYQFQKIIEKGGRTKPWVILVNEGNELVPYVVKMFTAKLIHERDSVTNEVLGNILAQQFDLSVPKAAFIEMDDNFYRTIDSDLALEMLDFADDRMKFATRLIAPSTEYQPGAYTSTDLKRMIDIDTVFAFDSLIKNADRTNFNPNLQVTGNSFYLLDHDLGLQITQQTAEEQIQLKYIHKVNRYHIFYEYLHSSWSKTQEQFFHTFEEYLRRLDLTVIDNVFNELAMFGYSTSRHQLLKEYFKILKYNSHNFATLMRYSIRL